MIKSTINKTLMKEITYFVKGMHCASCELLIEKKLLALKEVKSVEASADKGQVLILYQGQRPDLAHLNQIFRRENYHFFDQPVKAGEEKANNDLSLIAGASLAVIIVFFIIKDSGLSTLVNVNSASSLPALFLLGLIAGVSSCAALVGGLVLSMSKQWLNIYSQKESLLGKFSPHFLFNLGRIISYTILGGILGFLGSALSISLTSTSYLAIIVSIAMFFLALQMLGIKYFRQFQFTMPKFITRHIVDETNFQGKYMPFIMGALTFFLPCGFTITAQGLALISGSMIQGALIMLAFAFGTLPALLAIGLSAVKFLEKPHLANRFLKVAGVIVLFFSLYNINSQLNVLGFSSLNDIKLKQNPVNNEEGLAPIVNGKQLIKMDASSYGYQPNYFKIKVGIPVRWEITDTGTSGCTNAVISQSLFSGQISLTPGQTSVKEFTPATAGKYKFSCWMGMVSGIMEVVDNKNPVINSSLSNPDKNIISSGAKGCGCGGGKSL